jgi:hypothetical protein
MEFLWGGDPFRALWTETHLERLLRHGFVHLEEFVLVLNARDLEQGHAVCLLRCHCGFLWV